MRHDAVLWIQWQAEILAVVFLFHWRTLNLLSEAIRLETFIECWRIYARFYLGMTVAEIARIEGADRRRVWESIRRGLKKLARLLDAAR